MNDEIIALTTQALFLAFRLSLPVVLASAGVGVVVSLIQAVTHIQDQTLPFLLKLGVAVATLFVTGYWMFNELDRFAQRVFALLAATGRGAA
ncbi:type III secretion system export apparatus subunit SctS [Robbsia sp. Bb-Pol-6]|uniref:Type III secretion system export apparatus subunit SctS n=1 Tax=Robbsia betulipollinis TaxID=2981849 RepID=A0ABT3ZT79_9BURK|nr:type III secretion system export apparatus subunit SctS [Robbsia betulipollinis]MCY0389756.1 type III secretion system export apparatus subunit SctS [Robbsia betulipollinis]